MPRQCQFPVQFSDNRRCYRSSTSPGFTLCLALVAALAGYAGVSQAAPHTPHIAPHAGLPLANLTSPGGLLLAAQSGGHSYQLGD